VNTVNSVKYHFAKNSMESITSANFVDNSMKENQDMTEEAAKTIIINYLEARLEADKKMYMDDKPMLVIDGQGISPSDVEQAKNITFN